MRIAGDQILCEFHVVFVILGYGVPHLKECHRKALHRISLQADAGVLPESERLRSVEILVGQVVPSRIADFSVNYRDLSVVAVVQEQVESRGKGIEHAALDPVALRALDEIRVDKAEAPHVIVEHSDLYARFYSLRQDVPHLVPALRVFDRVVFHENELLGLGKISLLCLEPFLAVVKIFYLGVLVDRVSRLLADVVHQSAQTAVFLCGIFGHVFVCRQHGHQNLVHILIALAHFERMSVEADQKIERRSEDRQHHDHVHPCHSDRCRLMISVDCKYKDPGKDVQYCIDPSRRLSGPEDQGQNYSDLQKDRQDGEDHSADTVFNRCFCFQCVIFHLVVYLSHLLSLSINFSAMTATAVKITIIKSMAPHAGSTLAGMAS